MKLPEKIYTKINKRIENNTLRSLPNNKNTIDFSSNDYLGFAGSESIFDKTHKALLDKDLKINGATGSRLLSGNYSLYNKVENMLCEFHKSEAALIFNSGYDANIGFFSAVPQRGDVILYDEFIHASIRDGIRMSMAKAYKFQHNHLEDLKSKLKIHRASMQQHDAIYVVTESVFSMDGDTPDLEQFVNFCYENNIYLIVDEAHALGVFGTRGEGLLQELGLENKVFARIYTFGKALGCHGAAILGSPELKEYLINFSRSFIYTTGLAPHAVATIETAYEELKTTQQIKKLRANITEFKNSSKNIHFIPSDSAIHCCIISGSSNVKKIANQLQEKGYDVKAILSPTVPEGKERLRFCLHAYNSSDQIKEVLKILTTFTL